MFDFTEPSADMRVAATKLFQLYNALLQSGFSEDQAMRLLIGMVAGSSVRSPEE